MQEGGLRIILPLYLSSSKVGRERGRVAGDTGRRRKEGREVKVEVGREVGEM